MEIDIADMDKNFDEYPDDTIFVLTENKYRKFDPVRMCFYYENAESDEEKGSSIKENEKH